MEKDKTPDEIFSGTGPEYEVWIHISTGLDMARQELDSLSEKERVILTKFAEQFFSQRTKLTVDPEDTFAGLSSTANLPSLLEIPWLKFAADIAFAQEGVWRAERALDRYVECGVPDTLQTFRPGKQIFCKRPVTRSSSPLTLPASRSVTQHWNRRCATYLSMQT